MGSAEHAGTGLSVSHRVYVVLCAVFVTCLIVANVAGGKLFVLGPVSLEWLVPGLMIPSRILPTGIVPFPVTFVLTDLINEFYGKKGATFITLVGLAMSMLTFLFIMLAIQLPASPRSPLDDSIFQQVFGMSNKLIVASLIAYVIGQLLDIQLFQVFRKLTRERFLWFRATGSTVCSQLIDSLVVTFISFGATLSFAEIANIALNSYTLKFVVAVALTPLLYLGHAVIYRVIRTRIQHKRTEPAPLPDEDEPPAAIMP